MKKKWVQTASAFAWAGLFSCSTSPQDRIAEHKEVFDRLPQQMQLKVERGELEKGMTAPAVLLAWGDPDQKLSGWNGKKAIERWIYTKGGSGWSFGVGAGGSSYHGSRFGSGSVVGMSVPFNQHSRATDYVLFEKGKVVGWEKSAL